MTRQKEDLAKRQGRRQERGSNDSPESPDRSETSDIPGLPFGISASGKDCRVKGVLFCAWIVRPARSDVSDDR